MELRNRIIQEASILFFRNGIKSITMSDIANHMGISKRTLYEVFKDKEDLLEAAISLHTEQADAEKEKLLNESENVIDALMRIYAKNINETHTVNKSAIHDLKKYHPRLYNKIDWKEKDGENLFIPLFEKGVTQGLIRNDINFEILLWVLKAQFKMLMEGEFIPSDKYKLSEFIEAIIITFTRGVATPEGCKKVDEFIQNFRESK